MKQFIWLFITYFLLTGFVLADNPEQVFEKCGPSVVLFKNADDDTFGSGVLVSKDGMILTAAHLFEDKETFSIMLPGSEKKLPFRRFLFRDDDLDLAALQVSGTDLPHVRLGDPERVKIGQEVLTIGNPLGLDNSVSVGILSGKRPWVNDTVLFQTTAPISPGSSGGGLFDNEGNLLAITIAYIAKGQNLNFCIPVHYAELDRIPELDKRIEDEPSVTQHFQDRALAYYDCDEYDLALADIQTVLQTNPNDLEANDLRGECLFAQGRYKEALEMFSKTIEVAPTRAESYFDRGYTLYYMDEYDKAIPDLRKAVELEPKNEIANWALGRLLYVLDENLEAVKFLSEAIRISPENPEYYLHRGQAYFDAEDYDSALKDLTKSVELNGDVALTHFYLGRLAQIQDRTDESLKELDMAHSLAKDDGEILYYRALEHISLSNFEKALEDLDKAVALGYEERDLFYFRGLIFTSFGRYDRAISEFDLALEKDPEYSSAVAARGQAHAAAGNTNAARSDFRKVLTLEADEETLVEAKEALERLGD